MAPGSPYLRPYGVSLPSWNFTVFSIKTKYPVIAAFGAFWTVLIIVYPYLASTFSGFFASHPLFETSHFIPLLLTAAIVLPLVYKVLFRTGKSAFPGWVWTIAGILISAGCSAILSP